MRYTSYDADQIPTYMYNIANNFLVCCNPEFSQTSKCPYELEYICINNLYKTNEYFDVLYSYLIINNREILLLKYIKEILYYSLVYGEKMIMFGMVRISL